MKNRIGSVRRIVQKSEKWLKESAERFDPFGWTDPEEKYDQRKAFAELGMYVYVSEKLTGTADPRLRDVFKNGVSSKSYTELTQRYPEQARMYAAPLACAAELGFVDGDTVKSAQRVLDHPAIVQKERVPMRELDFAQLRVLVGLDPHVDIDDIVKRSALATPPNFIWCGLNDAYVLTHDVFYCYEFGHTNRFLDDPSKYKLTTTFDGLSLRYLAHGHTDVALELVMAGVLMEQISDATVNTIVDWIASVTAKRGFVPGPPDAKPMTLAGSEEVQGDNQNAGDEWQRNYHTNLIAAMTGKLLLSKRGDSLDLSAEVPDGTTTLAKTVDLLSKYKLREGAIKLNEAEFPDETYESVVSNCFDYIESQRNSEGTFGHWPDERHQFKQNGGNEAQFREQLVGGVSEKCQEVLEEFEER